MSDADLLASCPAFLSIGWMWKARPATEGGRRFVYMEASNEGLDQQDETVMAKALEESTPFFLSYGNVDIDHYTQVGAKLGIPDYTLYEIGRPVEVKRDGSKTFVKSEIYSGSGPAAERANMFWSSLVDLAPPARWYPSVGGKVLEKAVEDDPETGTPRALIKRVRWTNIGMSKTPVNQHVPACATVPMGALAKCWGPAGIDIMKALDAAAGTDAAPPPSYAEFRERLSQALRQRKIGGNPRGADLIKFAAESFGLTGDHAAKWCGRYLRDLKDGLNRRKNAS